MKYEVGIIGCGVAGMTAAIYLKRSGISCAIFESSMPGGQIVANDKIENYPGFSKISGSDLAISILNQVKELEIPVIFEKVEKIDNKGVEKEIVTDKNTYSTLRVIIATGRKSKKLNVLFEDKLLSDYTFTIRDIDDNKIFSISRNNYNEIEIIDFNTKEVNNVLEEITTKIEENLKMLEQGKIKDLNISSTFKGKNFNGIG